MDKLYSKFYKSFCNSARELSKQEAQSKANKMWNKLKKEDNFAEKVQIKIKEFELKTRFKQAKLDKFWANIPSKPRVDPNKNG